MSTEDQSLIPSAPIGMKPVLPNATAALILGILSIPGCCCFGVVSLVCGIIAIVLGSKAIRLYNAHPGVFTVSSYNNAKTGKICGMIGLVITLMMLLYVILVYVSTGLIFSFFH